MIRRPPRSTLFPLHDALPISVVAPEGTPSVSRAVLASLMDDLCQLGSLSSPMSIAAWRGQRTFVVPKPHAGPDAKSEKHTSELQSPDHLVYTLLLDKKITH